MNSRLKRTFLFLMAATALGTLSVYYVEVISALGTLLPPVLFSLALVWSNRKYLQSDAAYVYVPVAFFLVYFLGYVSVLWLASLITDNSLFQHILATLVTWTAIWLITWKSLNNLKVNYLQPLLIVVLAIAGNLLTDYLKWHFSSSDSPIFNPAGKSLIVNVLITQISLTVIILSMMNNGEATEENLPHENTGGAVVF